MSEDTLLQLQTLLVDLLASGDADRPAMFASSKVAYRPIECDYVLYFYTEAGDIDGIIRLSSDPQTAAQALYWFVTGKEPQP